MLSVAEYGHAFGVIKPSALNEWPAGIFPVATSGVANRLVSTAGGEPMIVGAAQQAEQLYFKRSRKQLLNWLFAASPIRFGTIRLAPER